MSDTKVKNEEIGAIWLYKTDKLKYYKGTVSVNGEKVQIILFQNSYKKDGDKTPDWRIYKSVPRTPNDNTGQAAMGENTNPSAAEPSAPKPPAGRQQDPRGQPKPPTEAAPQESEPQTCL